MRKINDIQDWLKFIDDCEKHIGGYADFGISQNGDDRGVFFMVKRVYSYGYPAKHYEGLFIGDQKTYDYPENIQHPASFFKDLTDKNQIPFYVYDSGANSNWL